MSVSRTRRRFTLQLYGDGSRAIFDAVVLDAQEKIDAQMLPACVVNPPLRSSGLVHAVVHELGTGSAHKGSFLNPRKTVRNQVQVEALRLARLANRGGSKR